MSKRAYDKIEEGLTEALEDIRMTHPTRAELVEAMARAMRSPPMKWTLWEREANVALGALCTLIPGLTALLDGTARVVPVKLLTEAHACMLATGWQLAPACDDGSDGVLNAAVAEIEDQFADILAASPTP